MVKHLIGCWRIGKSALPLAAVMWLGMTAPALAETLLDPTQPPDAAVSGGSGDGSETAGPVLQSVVLSSGRKMAIISGQSVRVGERFGDAELIRLTDQEAVLRAEDGTMQTLRMYPAIEKKVSRPAATVGAEHRKKKRLDRNTR